MTGGRFEPNRAADTPGQSELAERTVSWEKSGTWEHAETWDYEEAHANPEACDQLEACVICDRDQGPQFTRFQAAITNAPPAMAAIERRSRARPPAGTSWLRTVRTGNLCRSAVWLVGAASAGVAAGLVSINLVALALNPAASSVPAHQLATPSAFSAPAASSMTARTEVTARPAASDELAPTPPEIAVSEIGSRTVQTAQDPTPQAELVTAAPMTVAAMAALPTAAPAMPQADPTPAPAAALATVPAGNAHPASAPPAPSAVQQAALVEPAPGLAKAADASPVDRTTAPATPRAKVAADRASAEPAPTAPQGGATPLPAASADAPAARYRVQLALLRDEENVKYVWHDFVAQFGPAAKDFQRYVVARKTASGIRHLVQVGPFPDQDHAEAMCNRLKQRGGDCLVVEQPS
jgi:hypothetical protein